MIHITIYIMVSWHIYIYISWHISTYASDHFLVSADCVCLVALYPCGQKTADQFNCKADMDLSGEGPLWY